VDAETLKTQTVTVMDHIQTNSKINTIKHLFKPKTFVLGFSFYIIILLKIQVKIYFSTIPFLSNFDWPWRISKRNTNKKSQIECIEYYAFNINSKGFYFIPMKKTSKRGNAGSLNFTTNVFAFEGNDIPVLKNSVFLLQIYCSRIFYLLNCKNTMRAANIFNGS
jgi:hypothetical protein